MTFYDLSNFQIFKATRSCATAKISMKRFKRHLINQKQMKNVIGEFVIENSFGAQLSDFC